MNTKAVAIVATPKIAIIALCTFLPRKGHCNGLMLEDKAIVAS
jgi:hypothetical protein